MGKQPSEQSILKLNDNCRVADWGDVVVALHGGDTQVQLLTHEEIDALHAWSVARRKTTKGK